MIAYVVDITSLRGKEYLSYYNSNKDSNDNMIILNFLILLIILAILSLIFSLIYFEDQNYRSTLLTEQILDVNKQSHTVKIR